MNNKDADQTMLVTRPICTYSVCKYLKHVSCNVIQLLPSALAVNGQRVLNEFVQGRSNAWMQNGVLMKYNRNPEFIEITGPLQEDIEIQVHVESKHRTI